MNRENKRKKYEKHYYKNHACTDPFTCKVCGRLVVPEGAGSGHRNHCPNCLSSQHLDNEPGDREADCGGIMDPVAVKVKKKVYIEESRDLTKKEYENYGITTGIRCDAASH